MHRQRRRRDGRRRARRRAGPRSAVRPLLERFREAEIEDLHRAVVPDLDVGRLEVAMHDPLLVSGLQRLGNLLRDWERLVERDGTSSDAVRERRPSTSSMTSARSRPSLPGHESARCSGWLSDASSWASRLKRASRSGSCSHLREQHLDRDVAMQPGVVRAIHLTHPPAANQARGRRMVRGECLRQGPWRVSWRCGKSILALAAGAITQAASAWRGLEAGKSRVAAQRRTHAECAVIHQACDTAASESWATRWRHFASSFLTSAEVGSFGRRPSVGADPRSDTRPGARTGPCLSQKVQASWAKCLNRRRGA